MVRWPAYHGADQGSSLNDVNIQFFFQGYDQNIKEYPLMWLSYDHLCNIPEISLTNDFYKISVTVTFPSRCGIYLQYPSDISGISPNVAVI